MDELISKQAATTIPVMPKEHRHYQTNNLDDAYEHGWADLQECIENLPSAEPTITHEQAVDYLHKTGWLRNHDRILTESKVPLKGTWKDFTDEGYVECPFCKSATNCESKEEISDIHFCFSCGAMLKRGKAE